LKNFDGRDFLAALSLANLGLIVTWDGLLNATPDQTYLIGHPPPRSEFAAAFVNVLLIGLAFYLLIRLARWIAHRFGTVGLIFGSLPILGLIALPAVKSIVRLIANRFPDWDQTLVIGVLALVFVAIAALSRTRFLTFASAVLVTISPLILMEATLSIARCWTDRTLAYADGPLASRAPKTSLPRIVWIIFDDLDYRLVFLDRPATTPMPEFDRFEAASLFAENAVSPADYTKRSVPSMLTGKNLTDIAAHEPAKALFDGIPASAQPTIFSSVHAMGGNAAVVGWYIPYCRMFSQDLAACSSHDMENELAEPGSTFLQSISVQQQSLYAYGNRSLLGESARSKQRIAMLNAMHRDALREVVDPSLNLVLLHFPVPHAPYLYDRFAYTFTRRYLGTGTYLDNLVLADVFLGDLRDSMTVAGLWDKTTVLVTSDHTYSMSVAIDGQGDPRVPFLLKLAGQTSGVRYEPILHTVETKSLLEAILNREVATPEDAVNWLTAHPE